MAARRPDDDVLVVLISGCSSGFGKAFTIDLAKLSIGKSSTKPRFLVYATARKLESLEYCAQFANVRTIQLDITKDLEVSAAVRRVEAECGRIDLLINNAGIMLVGPWLERSLSDAERLMQTNFFGMLRVIKAVAPGMIARRAGTIINVSSIAAMSQSPFAGQYCMTKAAVSTMTGSLYYELQPFGVDVVLVEPGFVRTKILKNATRDLEAEINEFKIYKTASCRKVFLRAASPDYFKEKNAPSCEDFSAKFCAMIVSGIERDEWPRVWRAGAMSTIAPISAHLFPMCLLDRLHAAEALLPAIAAEVQEEDEKSGRTELRDRNERRRRKRRCRCVGKTVAVFVLVIVVMMLMRWLLKLFFG